MKQQKSEIKLYVRYDVGSGRPIVLLHGIFGDGTLWIKIRDLLKKDFRVIVVDLLGHGRSPRPKHAKYAPAEHVQALRLALVEIGATDDITLVGYSMGGTIALSYAATYGSDISQLYLISTPFYLKPEDMVSTRYTSSVLITKISQVSFRIAEHYLRRGKVLDKAVSYADTSKQFHKMIGATDNKLDSKIISHLFREMIGEYDFAKYLKKVTAPITLYAGKKDPFVIQGQLYALRQFKPYMEIKRLDIIKIDHMLVQNLPHEMATLLSATKNRYLHIDFDQGKGNTLILLHGIESSSNYWESIMKVLSKQRRVIAIDLLGFGQSPKPRNIAYSLDEHVAWLDRTIINLGVKSFSIAGHSLGALVALAYVAHNKNVVSMTLFSPVILSKKASSTRVLHKGLKYIEELSDSSTIYSQITHSMGEKRLAACIPMMRSIENSVARQNIFSYMPKLKDIPIAVYFGEKDQLVDEVSLRHAFRHLRRSTITKLNNAGHNFAIFSPEIALRALQLKKTNEKVAKVNKIPKTFMKQLFQLAVPSLAIKGFCNIAAGALLFTDFAPATLTIGLAGYVGLKSYNIIKSAFSLRNEKLSYIGYVFLGIGTAVVAYVLIKNPTFSLKVAVFIICGAVLGMGIMRLLVALLWTKDDSLRFKLFASGALFTLVGCSAIAGSLASIYIVVYALAALLILRGIRRLTFASGLAGLAVIRGFNK